MSLTKSLLKASSALLLASTLAVAAPSVLPQNNAPTTASATAAAEKYEVKNFEHLSYIDPMAMTQFFDYTSSSVGPILYKDSSKITNLYGSAGVASKSNKVTVKVPKDAPMVKIGEKTVNGVKYTQYKYEKKKGWLPSSYSLEFAFVNLSKKDGTEDYMAAMVKKDELTYFDNPAVFGRDIVRGEITSQTVASKAIWGTAKKGSKLKKGTAVQVTGVYTLKENGKNTVKYYRIGSLTKALNTQQFVPESKLKLKTYSNASSVGVKTLNVKFAIKEKLKGNALKLTSIPGFDKPSKVKGTISYDKKSKIGTQVTISNRTKYNGVNYAYAEYKKGTKTISGWILDSSINYK